MSPELVDPQRFGFKNGRPTKFSDCYALGMVIYETISGHPPFFQYGDMTVFVKVLAGEGPLRGVGFADRLWNMLEWCWASEPSDRPRIEVVLQCLESDLNLSEPLLPGVDEEMGTSERSWDPAGEEYDSGAGVPYHPTGLRWPPSPDNVYKRLIENIKSFVPPHDTVSDIVLFPNILTNPPSMAGVAFTGLCVHPTAEI